MHGIVRASLEWLPGARGYKFRGNAEIMPNSCMFDGGSHENFRTPPTYIYIHIYIYICMYMYIFTYFNVCFVRIMAYLVASFPWTMAQHERSAQTQTSSVFLSSLWQSKSCRKSKPCLIEFQMVPRWTSNLSQQKQQSLQYSTKPFSCSETWNERWYVIIFRTKCTEMSKKWHVQ